MGIDPDNSGLHARQNAGIFKVRGPADVMPDAAPGGAAIFSSAFFPPHPVASDAVMAAASASNITRCFLITFLLFFLTLYSAYRKSGFKVFLNKWEHYQHWYDCDNNNRINNRSRGT